MTLQNVRINADVGLVLLNTISLEKVLGHELAKDHPIGHSCWLFLDAQGDGPKKA